MICHSFCLFIFFFFGGHSFCFVNMLFYLLQTHVELLGKIQL